jgi:hypothetical protein
MKKILTISILFIALMFSNFLKAQQVEIQNIDSAIKTGNSKNIAKYFSNSITLNLLGNENVYSKVQAEQILKDFLSKNDCANYQLKHQGNSRDKSVFVIGGFNSNDKKFRTYYFLKKEGDIFQIKELKIEEE